MAPAEQDQAVVYQFGKFILDARERVLLADGKPVHLTNKVFETLLLLVRHNGRLLTKDEMMAAIWQDSFVEESNLTKNISRLRKILNTSDTQLIETLPKTGYRFLADVQEVDGDGTLLLSRNLRVRITHTEADQALSANPVSHETPPGPALLPPRKTVWKPVVAVCMLAAVLGLGLYFWLRPTAANIAAADKSGPVRLTNSPYHEDIAHWTTDNRIVFARVYSPGDTQTLVIDPDGTGERPASDHADLRSVALSRDGKKVLFLRQRDGVITTHIANADGSGETELPFRNGPLDWSPDGKRVVFNSNFKDRVNSEIYIFDFETKKLINISNNPAFDANPAFSPDGKQVVFNSNRDDSRVNNTYLMNADGTNVRRLTDHPAGEAFPSFSPDGTQIIFESQRENERVGIYLVGVDGQSPPIKISDTAYNSEIRTRPFSPDGTQIVFTSDKDGDRYNVYRMSAEPFKPRIVIESSDKDLTGPAISPDGKLIAYQARAPDKSAELLLFDLERERSNVLLRSADSGFSPAWSPSGDLIAISRKDQGNTDICTIRPDGSELKNLTAHPSTDFSPAWSATGEEIFFASNRDGAGAGATRLFRMNRDGSQQRSATDKYGYEMTPAISPDGRSLAFAGDRQDGRSRALDIFLFRFDDPGNEQIIAVRPGHDSAPAFSPDGRRIAFVSNADGNQEIYLVNTDGTGLVRFTRDPADDTLPTFSPDGKRIIFSSNRNGRYAIYEAELPY